MQTLYIDIETTGLNKYAHGIISLSYIIDNEKGEIINKGTKEMNPLSYTNKVSKEALKVNGYTLERFKYLPDAKDACSEFISLLNRLYNGDKYKIVAYNAEFDIGFLQQWMNKMSPGTYPKLIDYKHLDPFALVKYLQHLKKINTGHSQSLEAVARYYNLKHTPHNSESDVAVSREINKILIKEIL